MNVVIEHAPGELAERLDEVLDEIREAAEADRGLRKGHAHGERHPTEGVENPELRSMIEQALEQAHSRAREMHAQVAAHLRGTAR